MSVKTREQSNSSELCEYRGVPESESDIEAAVRRCKKLVRNRALVSAGASVVPIPGLSVTVDVTLMAMIMNQVNTEFGLTPQEIARLSTDRQLELFGIITAVGSICAGKLITVPIVMALLKRFSLQYSVAQVAKWVPIAGQAASAAVSFAAIKYVGDRHIKDCAAIARKYAQLRLEQDKA